MMNVLFISIAFPPKNDPESIQTAKYFKFLAQDKNCNFTVVTSANPTLFMPVDIKLNYQNKASHLIELKIYENKFLNFILRKLSPSLIEKPDSKFTFHLQWKKVVKRLLDYPDVIYSRSFPLSSSILSYKLSKHLNVPWIMHLSDPWSISPIHNFSDKIRLGHQRMEEMCFKQASFITLTSQQTCDCYKEIYPEMSEKFIVYPNVFDKVIDNDTKRSRNKLRLTYTGGLANTRSIIPFIQALKLLKSSYPTTFDSIEIHLAGQFDRVNSEIINSNKYLNIINHGLVSFEEAISMQQQSDILLLIDSNADSDNVNMFFPSKLLDYLIVQRPIIAFTSKNSTAKKMIETDWKIGKTFDFNSHESFVNYMVEQISKFKEFGHEYFYHNFYAEEYSAQFNSDKLAQLLKTIAK